MLPSKGCVLCHLPMLHATWPMAYGIPDRRDSSSQPSQPPSSSSSSRSHHAVGLPNPAAFQPCQQPTPHHHISCMQHYVCLCSPPRHPHQSQPPQQQLSTVEYYWSRAARRTKASTRCWMRGPAPAIVELCYRQGAYSIVHSKKSTGRARPQSVTRLVHGRPRFTWQNRGRPSTKKSIGDALPILRLWQPGPAHACIAVLFKPNSGCLCDWGRGTQARVCWGFEWANVHHSTARF